MCKLCREMRICISTATVVSVRDSQRGNKNRAEEGCLSASVIDRID